MGVIIITNTKYKNPLTVRKTEEMEEMLDFLQKKLLLTPTSIMRIGLARLYESEINFEILQFKYSYPIWYLYFFIVNILILLFINGFNKKLNNFSLF